MIREFGLFLFQIGSNNDIIVKQVSSAMNDCIHCFSFSLLHNNTFKSVEFSNC